MTNDQRESIGSDEANAWTADRDEEERQAVFSLVDETSDDHSAPVPCSGCDEEFATPTEMTIHGLTTHTLPARLIQRIL